MITVKQLIEMLNKVRDQSALVHINGTAICGIEIHDGRFADTYDGRDSVGNVKFRKTPKGKQKGLTFTHFCENSDSVIRKTEDWNY